VVLAVDIVQFHPAHLPVGGADPEGAVRIVGVDVDVGHGRPSDHHHRRRLPAQALPDLPQGEVLPLEDELEAEPGGGGIPQGGSIRGGFPAGRGVGLHPLAVLLQQGSQGLRHLGLPHHLLHEPPEREQVPEATGVDHPRLGELGQHLLGLGEGLIGPGEEGEGRRREGLTLEALRLLRHGAHQGEDRPLFRLGHRPVRLVGRPGERLGPRLPAGAVGINPLAQPGQVLGQDHPGVAPRPEEGPGRHHLQGLPEGSVP